MRDVAGFFLKLGVLAFGGPAAHVALMEDELVRRRRWLSRETFLDLLAVSNLLPGPSSTELAIFIGYRLRGFPGLLLAGACFICPAFLMVGALAWAYVRYGSLPAAAGLLYGVKPVVIAIVAQALWRLAGSAVKTRGLAVLGLLALVASFAGVPPLAVLAGAGALAVASSEGRRLARRRSPTVLAAIPLAASVGGPPAAVAVGGASVFLAFLKLGCVVFGSGYVLLAFLQSDLVERRHWLTSAQLIDAVAVGQVTPGPVFTTATFIGYLVAGPKGAIAATAGIFAPAFALVALAGPIVGRLRESRRLGEALDGLNVAALALMAYVSVELARTAVRDWATAAITLVSITLLLRFRLNATWLVALGAATGLIVMWVRR